VLIFGTQTVLSFVLVNLYKNASEINTDDSSRSRSRNSSSSTNSAAGPKPVI